MAIMNFKTWETIDIFPTVDVPTEYTIVDYNFDLDPEGGEQATIYKCTVLPGHKLYNINNILSQYISPKPIENFIDDGLIIDDWYHKHSFYIKANNVTTDELTVKYDWSYTSYRPNYLSKYSTNKILDARQYFVATYEALYRTQSTIKIGDEIKTLDYPKNTLGTVMYNLNLTDAETLEYQGMTFTIKNTCKDYCLYYLNSMGGYDFHLFNKSSQEIDNITRYNYREPVAFSPNQTLNFGNQNYLIEDTNTWKLNTDNLTEAQANNLKDLFTSPRIYLQDLNTGFITPVLITNNSFEHKNYYNQKRQFIKYQITVESSWNKIIR